MFGVAWFCDSDNFTLIFSVISFKCRSDSKFWEVIFLYNVQFIPEICPLEMRHISKAVTFSVLDQRVIGLTVIS